MSLRMTEEEYADFMRQRCANTMASPMTTRHQKRQKYGNRKVEIDGMKFDSQHEADYYFGVLIPRIKAGELKCVCRQVPIDLPGGIRYIADFVTIKPDMTVEAVIDAKSEATRRDRTYINKRKQVRACWGIEIIEV